MLFLSYFMRTFYSTVRQLLTTFTCICTAEKGLGRCMQRRGGKRTKREYRISTFRNSIERTYITTDKIKKSGCIWISQGGGIIKLVFLDPTMLWWSLLRRNWMKITSSNHAFYHISFGDAPFLSKGSLQWDVPLDPFCFLLLWLLSLLSKIFLVPPVWDFFKSLGNMGSSGSLLRDCYLLQSLEKWNWNHSRPYRALSLMPSLL